jgi:hypothetical protein
MDEGAKKIAPLIRGIKGAENKSAHPLSLNNTSNPEEYNTRKTRSDYVLKIRSMYQPPLTPTTGECCEAGTPVRANQRNPFTFISEVRHRR